MSGPFYIFTREQIKYILAIFILGIIIGSTGLNLLVSNRIDNLILNKNELEKKIEQQNQKIEKLEQNIQEHKNNFITDIVIEIDSDLNKHKQQVIKEKIFSLLENQIGKNVDQFDPVIITDIIDQRLISYEDTEIKIKLKYLIIYNQELHLTIEIQE
ncbi:MAG: hypothetical protein ACOCP5_02110 [Halanaerobiaceae bacterium]